MKPATVLLIGIGNPSRGDDAIGPLAIERLATLGLRDTELLTDFQLQVEHALDLVGHCEVIFIDATTSGPEPFDFAPVYPATHSGPLSHALSPASVLAVYARITAAPLPAAFVLAVRGYDFTLGATLTENAAANLDAALHMLATRIGVSTNPA